ncbi:MAG: energy-coupling factor transporter transmembrane component T family protein [Candidatus Bathyarchaeota archaeon]
MVYKLLTPKRESPLFQLDPRAKFLTSSVIGLYAIFTSNFKVLILLFLLIFMINFLGKLLIEWLKMLKSFAILISLIFIVEVLHVYFSGEYVSLKILMESPVTLTLKFIILISAFTFFYLSTPPEAFTTSIQQVKFIPYSFSLALTIALRFIPILTYEFQEVYEAQRSRGVELEKGNIVLRVKNMASMLTPLMVKAVKKSFEVAEALEVRCYGVKKPKANIYVSRFGKVDLLFICGVILALTSTFYV